MKKPALLTPVAAVLCAAFVSLGSAQTPHLDPATGIPVSGGPGAPVGLPPMDAAFKAAQARQDAIDQIHKLIASGDYDEALKNCQAFQSQLKGNDTLEPLLADWVELGRRFPAAREALAKIRDHDVAEFKAGSGYAVLFSELKAINSAWNEDDATETLYKSLWRQDRKLAEQCYGAMEGILMQKGEYAFCLECIGDPRDHFDGIVSGFQMQVALQQQQAAWRQFTDEQNKRFHRAMPPAFSVFYQGKAATNNFVGQVVTLETILAGAGRQADADLVRDQALAIVDSDRIRNAISAKEPQAQP